MDERRRGLTSFHQSRQQSQEAIREPDEREQGARREDQAEIVANLVVAGESYDELWADPGVYRNTHSFSVQSDESNFEVQVAGVPSASNPATDS